MRRVVFVISLMAVCGSFSSMSYSQTMTAVTTADIKRQNDEDYYRSRIDAINQNMKNIVPRTDERLMYRRKKLTKASAEAEKDKMEAQKALTELRSVNPEDEMKYNGVLASGIGGLFRLFPDFDCTTRDLVRVDGDCAAFVDSSSDYSFRQNVYVDGREGLGDIHFNHNKIISEGFLENGILVSLGDIPIENVKLTDTGLKFLVDFKPALKYREALELESGLHKGIDSGGYTYTDSLSAQENTTYAFRAVAYKHSFIGAPLADRRFLQMRLDNRVDQILVFRIVRRDVDGSITILWRELAREKAPTLSIEKRDLKKYTGNDK